MGGAGNLACSRLFSRLFEAAHRPRKAGRKAGCSQDWLPHLAANESLQPAKQLKFSRTGCQACVVFVLVDSPRLESLCYELTQRLSLIHKLAVSLARFNNNRSFVTVIRKSFGLIIYIPNATECKCRIGLGSPPGCFAALSFCAQTQ